MSYPNGNNEKEIIHEFNPGQPGIPNPMVNPNPQPYPPPPPPQQYPPPNQGYAPQTYPPAQTYAPPIQNYAPPPPPSYPSPQPYPNPNQNYPQPNFPPQNFNQNFNYPPPPPSNPISLPPPVIIPIGNVYVPNLCQRCGGQLVLRRYIGANAWCLFIILLCCFPPFCFLPFCIEGCQDVQMSCNKCGY